MNIFFHHVGQEGAKSDFKKTIYSEIDIEFVENILPNDYINKSDLIEMLKDRFPSGKFNCWGAPAGAKTVIKNLKEGDYVFLVESSRIDGTVPALCRVKLFWPYEIRELSTALWEQPKFSYIFFFNTEELNLMWIQFLKDMGYKVNFSPRGNFYKVKADRFSSFGGTAGYINNILYNHLKCNSITSDEIIREHKASYTNIDDLESEVKNLIEKSLDKPELTAGLNSKYTVINKMPRDTAFSILVKKIYNFKCAICGMGLKSPSGKYEVQAAHIYPKSKDGSDDLRNGICLCHLHHWALDAGWISISDNYKILVREDIPNTNEYSCINHWKERKITLPQDGRFNPHPLYLKENRDLNGFK